MLRVVRVCSLNLEDHYRIQVESPNMDLHTVKQWSVSGPVPPNVLEDILATFNKELAERIPVQLPLW